MYNHNVLIKKKVKSNLNKSKWALNTSPTFFRDTLYNSYLNRGVYNFLESDYIKFGVMCGEALDLLRSLAEMKNNKTILAQTECLWEKHCHPRCFHKMHRLYKAYYYSTLADWREIYYYFNGVFLYNLNGPIFV